MILEKPLSGNFGAIYFHSLTHSLTHSLECVDFNNVRQRFYQVPTLQDLFKTVKPEVILDFLKAAALYRLL